MKRKLIPAAVLAVAAAGLAAPAEAAGAQYGYIDFAGATQVRAIGMTVSSDATAGSSITGWQSKSASNKIASATVGTLLGAGAATTSTTATVSATGAVTLVAHARTTGISLLGGMIKADAIDTTATIKADGATTPTTTMTTSLVGLTINGKAQPTTVKPNTGISIPGVLTVGLNAQATGASIDGASIQGTGVLVTLLASRNGADAGTKVMINPISQLLEVFSSPDVPGVPLMGTAYAAFAHASVTGAADIATSRFAQVSMLPTGTWGDTRSNNLARASVVNLLNLGTLHSEEVGTRTTELSESRERSTIASLSLFNGLITASGIGSTADAKVTKDGVATTTGSLTFVRLTIAGRAIPLDVAPNTTIHVANLGRVTINEQVATARTGFHAFRTEALHIVLDTRRAGLPVGAEVEVAVASAGVFG
jgi:hypothetical protein